MNIGTTKLLVIAQLIWLYFKETPLFPMWLFWLIIPIYILADIIADKINKKLVKDFEELRHYEKYKK